MKLSLKDLVKLIAPYLVAIGGAIGTWAHISFVQSHG